MKKNCPDCGCFMKLTDMFIDDELDEELFIACGHDLEDYDPDNESHQRFNYVYDVWECNQCGCWLDHADGKKYYYNPEKNDYSGEKPLTPMEQIQADNAAQEAAGQLRLEL